MAHVSVCHTRRRARAALWLRRVASAMQGALQYSAFAAAMNGVAQIAQGCDSLNFVALTWRAAQTCVQ